MRRDGVATALNALANASRRPVAEADLRSILATGDGPGHLVRALFEDCSFETLDRAAAAIGLSRERLRASYRNAKLRHAVANVDLDAAPSRSPNPTRPPGPSRPGPARS